MFELQLNRLFPCNVYPEKQLYETVVPQLYGPVDGLVLALVTVGGLLHSQTSVWTEKSLCLSNNRYDTIDTQYTFSFKRIINCNCI